MKNLVIVLASIAIILGTCAVFYYTYTVLSPTPEEKISVATAEANLQKERAERYEREEAADRETMKQKESIEKICASYNEEILDKNTLSAGEYVGIRIGLGLLGL
jgi:hypothetical protein